MLISRKSLRVRVRVKVKVKARALGLGLGLRFPHDKQTDITTII